MPSLHPTAVVDPRAELAEGVEVGPHCVVGSQVRIGRGTRLMGHVTVLGRVTLGEENRVFPGAVLGGDPQDVSYRGSDTELVIGDRNVIREGVTINRATEKEDGLTTVGSDARPTGSFRVTIRSVPLVPRSLTAPVLVGDGTIGGGSPPAACARGPAWVAAIAGDAPARPATTASGSRALRVRMARELLVRGGFRTEARCEPRPGRSAGGHLGGVAGPQRT